MSRVYKNRIIEFRVYQCTDQPVRKKRKPPRHLLYYNAALCSTTYPLIRIPTKCGRCDQVSLIKTKWKYFCRKRFARKQRRGIISGAIIFYDMGVLRRGVLMSFLAGAKVRAEFTTATGSRSGADDRNGWCNYNKLYRDKKINK